MGETRQWFGARRLVLRARYAGERARARMARTFAREPRSLSFDDIHRRLELVLTAAYGHSIAIVSIDEGGWVRRRVRGLLPRLVRESPPTIDGGTIRLPAWLATGGDRQGANDRYRLLAMEQAERIARGTLAHAAIADPLERDLYLLREAAAIDARIARVYPGMQSTLERERSRALERRPAARRMTPPERDVESMLITTLKTPPAEYEHGSSDPAASREWARETASEIRLKGGRYRGVPLAAAWGTLPPASIDMRPLYNPPASFLPGPQQSGGSGDDANQNQASQSELRSDEASESDTRPDKRGRKSDSGDPSEHNDQTSAPQQSDDGTGTSSSNDAPPNAKTSPDAGGQGIDSRDDITDDLPAAIYYDEWNSDRGSYSRGHTAVRLYRPKTGNPQWLRDELQNHAATARQIRHQFERLRARRTLSVRQLRGDMLDLSACVDAIIARRMGDAADDRLYVDARPARRGIAISLLIDASGSTDRRVTESWRIIDLEKIALLLATQALDALGDLHAIYAFAGRKASNVKIVVVKDFSEANGDEITRRIAAVTPDGFTRLGAAVRHASLRDSRRGTDCFCCCPTVARTTSTSIRVRTALRIHDSPSSRLARPACFRIASQSTKRRRNICRESLGERGTSCSNGRSSCRPRFCRSFVG